MHALKNPFLLASAVLTLVGAAATGTASAQSYPAKPITLIVAFPGGSDTDLSARNLAQQAQKHLNNQPIVVQNRPGASGAIGTVAARTAPADGYTLLAARIATHAILPAIDSKTPYKWNDFTLISTLEINPYVCVVRSDASWKTLADLVGELRRNPGKLNFSTAGAGTLQNLGPQYLFSLAGLPKDAGVGIHYKGSGELTTSLLGGQVQFACNNLGTLLPHIQQGALRAILTTTRERLPELPDTPTARAAGFPDLEKLAAWSALAGPPGLPHEVVERWTDVLGKLARDRDWLGGLEKLGAVAAIRSPADTERFVREQAELYEKLVASLGLRE